MTTEHPNVSLFAALVKEVSFPNFPIPINVRMRGNVLHITIETPDRLNGEKKILLEKHEEIPPWFQGSPSDVEMALRFVVASVMDLLRHEVEEQLLWRGQRALDPHKPKLEFPGFNPEFVVNELLRGLPGGSGQASKP